jgi:hypothetical protein
MERKVVTRAPHREVGVINPAWLLDHAVEHESHLEKRFIMAALACPVVVDIVHQPLHIWLSPNETEKYTPDFGIGFRDRDTVLVEVKPEVFLAKHAEKLRAAAQHFKSQGKKFLVLTDKHIDANGLGTRAILLMRYGRVNFSEQQALDCLALLKNECHGEAKVKDLVELGVSEALIWNMVAKHRFRVPVGLNISPEESVSINGAEGDCCDYFHTWFGAAQG